MGDPRFDGQTDMKAVVKNPGWYAFEHVGEISGGTGYTDDMPGRANDSRWLEFYAATAESIQSPHLARFYLKMLFLLLFELSHSSLDELLCDFHCLSLFILDYYHS